MNTKHKSEILLFRKHFVFSPERAKFDSPGWSEAQPWVNIQSKISPERAR